MATLFISAKPPFLPDSEGLGNWTVLPGTEDFYVIELGNHHIIAHPCIKDEIAIPKKASTKHRMVATWLDTILPYIDKEWGTLDIEDFYMICHDKDLIDCEKEEHREDLYREVELSEGLKGRVKDGHIYAFMHSPGHPIYEALIVNLFDEATPKDVENAIQIINALNDEKL